MKYVSGIDILIRFSDRLVGTYVLRGVPQISFEGRPPDFQADKNAKELQRAEGYGRRKWGQVSFDPYGKKKSKTLILS